MERVLVASPGFWDLLSSFSKFIVFVKAYLEVETHAHIPESTIKCDKYLAITRVFFRLASSHSNPRVSMLLVLHFVSSANSIISSYSNWKAIQEKDLARQWNFFVFFHQVWLSYQHFVDIRDESKHVEAFKFALSFFRQFNTRTYFYFATNASLRLLFVILQVQWWNRQVAQPKHRVDGSGHLVSLGARKWKSRSWRDVRGC